MTQQPIDPIIHATSTNPFGGFQSTHPSFTPRRESDTSLNQENSSDHQLIRLLYEASDQRLKERFEALEPQINVKIEELVNTSKNNILDEITKSRKELETVRNSLLGSIAIFASFFTFISINVSIFSKTSSAFENICILLIMWFCLMGFIYTFFLFLWDKAQDVKCWLPIIVGMVLSSVLLFFIYPYKNVDVKSQNNKNLTKNESKY